MKLFIIIFLIGLSSNLTFAQDIIVKSNGDEIKSKVLEITIETIKYKEFEFQDGPIRNIKISDVFMIIYENGKRDTFASKQDDTTGVDSITTTSNDEQNMNYFTIGPGLGSSYGGIGIRCQWSITQDGTYRMHAGLGALPEYGILPAIGLKYFFNKYYYINGQIGIVAEETTFSVNYSESNMIFGPSFLVGADWAWGSKVAFGVNFGAGLSYILSSHSGSSLAVAFDLGLFIGF